MAASLLVGWFGIVSSGCILVAVKGAEEMRGESTEEEADEEKRQEP